jgi:arabinofuranosyltransferase
MPPLKRRTSLGAPRRDVKPARAAVGRRPAPPADPPPPEAPPEPAPPAALLRAAGAALLAALIPGLYLGWRLFWFLTDDAHIAFHYVENSLLGHGYVWNPPPFLPVEGYTSFLFVATLDLVWRLTGVAPPRSSNTVLLLCGYATLGVALWCALRMRLTPRLEPLRLPLAALALLAVVANRTFLAWTSSGLETAMFNLFFMLWIASCARLPQGSPRWLLATSASATLVCLTRPDGLLLVGATLAAAGAAFALDRRVTRRQLACLSPLAVVAVHLLWRRSVYGLWLPTTYYAKVSGAWPAAGLRYLLSFVVEYSLWTWLLLVALAAWRHRAWLARRRNLAWLSRPAPQGAGALGPVVATATVLAHVAYYTLRVGGDHFEYRVFSYLLPPLFLSVMWLLGRLDLRPSRALAASLAVVLLSLPIPWTHWHATRSLSTRNETHILMVPVAPRFPAPLRPYVEAFDDLQSWLIPRHICIRHQEHKVYYQYLERVVDDRRAERPPSGSFPVVVTGSPGVVSWRMPRSNIIDIGGLNDRVIARMPMRHVVFHKMAHDREPPPGYLECFRPTAFHVSERISFRTRDRPLTAADIRACERRTWRPEPEAADDGRAVAAPEAAARDGWVAVQSDVFANASREGLTRALRIIGRNSPESARSILRDSRINVLLNRGTLVRPLERAWLSGQVRVQLGDGSPPLWTFSEALP